MERMKENLEKVNKPMSAEKPEYVRIREMDVKEFIRWMYKNTDCHYHVIVPRWSADGLGKPRCYHRNTVMWNRRGRNLIIRKTEAIIALLAALAKHDHELSDSEEENAEILTPEELYVWHTFVRDFDMSAFDAERILELDERKEISDLCRDLLMKRDQFFEPLTEEEQKYLDEHQGDMLSADEEQFRKTYEDALQKQAAERVGDCPSAYPLIMHARLLYRMMALGAPDFVIRAEATYFAQMAVFHHFATDFRTMTIVGDQAVDRPGC